jgi:hypothetical protein
MKQIGLASHNYHDTFTVFVPSMLTSFANTPQTARSGHVGLLPYIDMANIYNLFNFAGLTWSVSASDVDHYKAITTNIPVFRCPSSTHSDTLNYGSFCSSGLSCMAIAEYEPIMGSDRYPDPHASNPTGIHAKSNGGIHLLNGKIGMRDVTDGSSNTMSFGEFSHAAPGEGWSAYKSHHDASHPWAMGYCNADWGYYSYGAKTIGYPPNGKAYYYYSGFTGATPSTWQTITQASLKSGHVGGVHALMADGAVRFISNNVDLLTYKNLADRSDGNPIGEF